MSNAAKASDGCAAGSGVGEVKGDMSHSCTADRFGWPARHSNNVPTCAGERLHCGLTNETGRTGDKYSWHTFPQTKRVIGRNYALVADIAVLAQIATFDCKSMENI